MAEAVIPVDTHAVLDRKDFASLLAILFSSGYRVVAPTVRNGAIVLGEIHAVEDLPIGFTQEQGPGSYRLQPRNDERFFGYAVGPVSAKRWLFPPTRRLWRAVRRGGRLHIEPEAIAPPKVALLGLRACDLTAIGILDRVLAADPYGDPDYKARRENCLILAVECAEPAPTCFCGSTGAGPTVSGGFDLCITELLDDGGHRFSMRAGTPAGERILSELPTRPPTAADDLATLAQAASAGSCVCDAVGPGDLRQTLYGSAESPRWKDTASRCLACGNCTMVCPTCFCSTTFDNSDLTGEQTERHRIWDSCFNAEFSYIHGGNVRQSVASRYRQWVTHKFAAWIDQFGTLGCVGCGRCIAWCPVGIDLRKEVEALRKEQPAAATQVR